MLILFHSRKIQGEMSSYRVHIFEVLNGLLKLGHTVIYSDGQYYSPISQTDKPCNISVPPQRKSFIEKIKAQLLALPIKNELLVLWRLMNELKLLCTATITIVRHKPAVIYWRNDISYGGNILAGIFRIPSIVEVNGIIVNEIRSTRKINKFTLNILDKMERLSLWKSVKYIVVTADLKTMLIQNYGIPQDKIITIENGANTELFKPLSVNTAKMNTGLNLCDNYICYVGELLPWSGSLFLIKAMPYLVDKYPDVKALIIGNGYMYPKLKALSEQLGVSDRVVFTGRVPYERVPQYINASDICVVPSIKDRNQQQGASPLKLCEYLSCGKPVVASRLKGLETLEEFNCGYLVTPEEPEELANALIRLLNDPGLRLLMGDNGRQYVLKNRSWASVVKNISDILQKTVQELQQRR